MAAASAEEKSDTPAPMATPSSGGGNKILAVLTVVNLIATMGMIAILFISFQREKTRPAVEDIVTHSGSESPEGEKEKGKGEEGKGEGKSGAKKNRADLGKMVTLEQFTVNLSTPGSVNPKFVRVNISLEVPTEDTESEVGLKMPQVRNAIIDLFNSKKANDLSTAEGRDYIKEEIKNAINGFMVTGKVKGVFFTNFAVAG